MGKSRQPGSVVGPLKSCLRPRTEAPTSLSVAVEHPGGERSFITAPGNLEHLTADGILTALPAKASHGDIALFTGVFLYPKLLASFGAIFNTVGKRGYKLALDTGWPPVVGQKKSRVLRAAGLPIATICC